ncbi:SDR family oxidoreductase [Modestobacter sp. NPDC049651]|uniref:SDR family oxidoreductase n=1 Tax=unclassified Modestobacter TaxID=2643866 RepID=UPI0033CCD247
MDLSTTTALVTGANRGFGRALAAELAARGARVHAAARRPETVDLPGVTPLALDVTDPASIARAVEATGDVTLLVNNAGIDTRTNLLEGDLADVQAELDTNYLGTLQVTRAFLPQVEAAGGGIVNVLSVLSWLSFPGTGAYAAAKSAAWSMTNALRAQLAPRGVTVAAVHVGYMDTDMTEGITAPKSDPAEIARLVVDAIEAGSPEVVADEVSRQVQAGLAGGVAALYPQLV